MADELFKAAVDITKAQAAVREMKPEEVQVYLQTIHGTLTALSGNHVNSGPTNGPGLLVSEEVQEDVGEVDSADAAKSIKEKVICCLICGKEYKMLTKKHLASHGLTRDEYLEKYNFPKGTKLVCKKTQKERRAKMKEMRLWERKGLHKKEAVVS